MRKNLAIQMMVVMLILTSCSSSDSEESGETLEFVLDLAKLTGSLDGARWDSSTDGAKGPWCYEMANLYIRKVMGFDGGNGTDRMGKVSLAYNRACNNS